MALPLRSGALAFQDRCLPDWPRGRLYSSAKDTLRKALGGSEKLTREVHWSDLDDVALEEEQSATAREKEHDLLRTDVERMKIDADKLMAVEATAGRVKSVGGISFPMSADAATALSDLASGSLGVLVLTIEKEIVVLKASAPQVEDACASTSASASVRACMCTITCTDTLRRVHERACAAATRWPRRASAVEGSVLLPLSLGTRA